MNTRHYVIVWRVSIELPRFLLSSWVHQVTPARRCRWGPGTIWMVICKRSPPGKAKWKIEIVPQKVDQFHIHAYNSHFVSSPFGPKQKLEPYLNMCFPFAGGLLALCHMWWPLRGLESPVNQNKKKALKLSFKITFHLDFFFQETILRLQHEYKVTVSNLFMNQVMQWF